MLDRTSLCSTAVFASFIIVVFIKIKLSVIGVQVQNCSCSRGDGKFNCTLSNGWLSDEEKMNANTVNIGNMYLVLMCSGM